MPTRITILSTLVLVACTPQLSAGAPATTGPHDDFPPAPVIDPSAPSDAAAQFPSASGAGAGPCIVEPQAGSLVPDNWLRPRFRWLAASDQVLFELRVHSGGEASDLVVYTALSTWTMPDAMWRALAANLKGKPLAVTVRAASLVAGKVAGAASQASASGFTIAPVGAAGSIVYWTSTGGTALKGFNIGDETVRTVFTPAQAGAQCVGCHGATPDGNFVGAAASDDPGNGDPARVALRTSDGKASPPPFMTSAAATLLARTFQEQPTFSKAHWRAGDRVVLDELRVNDRWEIVWTDLEASSTAEGVGWGIVARGDGQEAASGSLSHDGQRVLYASSPAVSSGVTLDDGDLRTVAWNDRAGGVSSPVAGASDPGANEFYPTFSSDDKVIAFCRLPAGERSYNNPRAEVFVIPSTGGTATRLGANDPPACGGAASPGVTNSWPKWAPEATTLDGNTYYWVTFSSTREPGGNPQLFVAPVVVSGSEAPTVTTYPALYLWNQPADENNHTPAWDTLQIPLQ